MKKRTIYTLLAILTVIALSVDSSAQAPNTWTQKANVGATLRQGAVGFSIGAKGYLGTGAISSSNFSSDFWEYDTTNNAWTQKANLGGAGRWQAFGFSIHPHVPPRFRQQIQLLPAT
jgi:hypothetical protein